MLSILAQRRDRLAAFLDAHHKAVIVVLLSLGLLWRLAFFFETATGTTVNYLTIDERYHHEIASDIARGHWLQDGSDRVFIRAPLYYYTLAVVYWVAHSDNLILAKVLQILLSTASCWLVYLVARRLFNRQVGLIALFLSCFYGSFFYFAAQLLFETFLVFLCLAGLLTLLVACERRSIGWWLGAGLVFGLSAITRPNMLVFLAPLSIWIYFSQRRDVPLGRLALCVFVFYVGCGLPILPVTLHNYVIGHDFELIASQGGINFYIGNNARSDGVSAVVPEIEDLNGDLDSPTAYEDGNVFVRSALHDPNARPSQIDRYWYKLGMAWIRAHPGDYLRLMWRKFRLYWNDHEIGNDRSMWLVGNGSIFYHYLSFKFGLVTSLALAGVYLALRHRLRIGVLILFVVTFTASILIFFVNSRFRLPIVPSLILFAAYALHVWLFQPLRQPQPGAPRTKGLLVSVLVAAAGMIFVWPDAQVRAAESSAGYYMEGQYRQNAGDYARAVAAFEQCKQHADPLGNRYVLSSRLALGRLYTDSVKDYAKARQNFQEALRLAPNDFGILNDAGAMYKSFGHYDEAKICLSKALKLNPTSSVTMENLADCCEKMKDYDGAIAVYQQLASQAGPNAYGAWTHIANLCLLKGDVAGARANATRALALKPDYAPARQLLEKLP
jgi:4-amino-4-deoxy-L-arabinose transferase-like glycosyltransferase